MKPLNEIVEDLMSGLSKSAECGNDALDCPHELKGTDAEAPAKLREGCRTRLEEKPVQTDFPRHKRHAEAIADSPIRKGPGK